MTHQATPAERSGLSRGMRGVPLLLGLLAGSAAASELPAGEGKAIVEAACVQCHDMKTTTDARHGLEEWREVTYVMISEGADLLEEEVDVVARYLAEHFGPEESPGPAPETPGGAADPGTVSASR